jgi:hypothetical protein
MPSRGWHAAPNRLEQDENELAWQSSNEGKGQQVYFKAA